MSGDDEWLPDDEPLAPFCNECGKCLLTDQHARSCPTRRYANRAKAHTIATEAIRVALLQTGLIQLWPNPTGFDDKVKRPYGIGLGGADQVGLLKGLGRFVGFETKTGRARLSSVQRLWHAEVKKNGGFATVVHDDAEALAALKRATSFYIGANNNAFHWNYFE